MEIRATSGSMAHQLIFAMWLCMLPWPALAEKPAKDAISELVKSRMDIIGAQPAYQPPVALEDLGTLSQICAEQLRHQRISEKNPKYGSWLSSIQETGLLDQPAFAILKDAKSFHHYCWGELAQNRYYREVSAQKRLDLARYAASSIKYVIDHPTHVPEGWPFMGRMHADYASALLLTNENAAAAAAFQVALRLDPKLTKAYTGLADLQARLGQKPKALETVIEGLRYLPNSKALQRRYQELGGKLPFPEPHPELEKPTSPSSAEKNTGATQPAPDTSSPAQKSDPPPDKSPVAEVPKPATPTDDGRSPEARKANPYCRFCVD